MPGQQALDAEAKRVAAEIISASLVWDNHACMPLGGNCAEFLPELERLRLAGIDIVSLNIVSGPQSFSSALQTLEQFRLWVGQHSSEFMLIRHAADIEDARRTGRLGIVFDVEGMDALDGQLDRVADLYSLGVRWMLATYNRSNIAGGGCLEPDGGLTEFGRKAVAEMNSAGMVVCASHCGYRTAHELIDASSAPVIFSHSNASAVWDHPRNIPDTLIRACADRGGVIGVNGYGPFLGEDGASAGNFVHHVEHILDLVGDDHVGIALDYMFDPTELDAMIKGDPETFPPHLYAQGAQMIRPEDLVEVVGLLWEHGYREGTLAKLLGANHLRIAHNVWR